MRFPKMHSKTALSFLTILCYIYQSCGQNVGSNTIPKVERLTKIPPTGLGEGPHWDVKTQSLYFVDIFEKSIHKYVPATKKHTKAVVEGTGLVSFVIPVRGEKDKFAISIGRQLAVVTWNGKDKKVSKIEKIAEIDNHPDTLDNRFNDAKSDPSGRLWAGTMGGEPVFGPIVADKGSLFSFSNRKPTVQLTKVSVSNGLAWSSDHKKMYYIDSLKRTIDQFDFDIKKGTISGRKSLFTLAKNGIEGFPDGMTIDKNDNLWVANFNGSRILNIDTKKPETLLRSISIPARQVTSVTFGGPNLEDLYVTSAKSTVDNPNDGGTYRITGLNASGRPAVSVVIDDEISRFYN